jgi:DNA-binding transcriptional MerR regulator
VKPLKINEVEALVGITKKNIRFYEEAGLLTPRRNSENGYRDYSESDIDTLRRIKLLRKLGVPLEEIRQMQTGLHTIGDGMRRHLVTLEREQENLRSAALLCATLVDSNEKLGTLDAAALLERMEQMEQEGTTFMNKQTQDMKRRYIAPITAAIVMAVLMAGIIWLFLWAFKTDPLGAPPLPLLILLIAIPAVVILGVLIALIQRLREIGKSEIDDAKRY